MINSLFLVLFSLVNVLQESETHLTPDLRIGFFEKKDMSQGQLGCWYYFPAEEKQSGNVVALGEAAEEAIYIMVDGEKVKVGNWQATYKSTKHEISYHNQKYQVNIVSNVITEGRYASQYESELTVVALESEKDSQKINTHKVKVFAECGD